MFLKQRFRKIRTPKLISELGFVDVYGPSFAPINLECVQEQISEAGSTFISKVWQLLRQMSCCKKPATAHFFK